MQEGLRARAHACNRVVVSGTGNERAIQRWRAILNDCSLLCFSILIFDEL